MADKEEGDDNTSRGNEWEVVSLTASTYAAAPGPKEVELKDDNNDEAESSRALFMSNHFVFPPSQHENLPLEPEQGEILNEPTGKNLSSDFGIEDGNKSGGKDEVNWPLKGLEVSEEFPGMQFFDGKVNKLSISGKEFEESKTLPELSIHDKEQSIYSTSTFSSLHSETGVGGSTTYGENLGIPDVNEPFEDAVASPRDISHFPETLKNVEDNESDLPCEAWWKRRASSLYTHVKETNAFWSIFVAAAVMGLVIIGQHWQPERWRVLQLKWQCSVNEKTGRMLGPLSRLKDVIVGGHRCGSLVRGSSPSEN